QASVVAPRVLDHRLGLDIVTDLRRPAYREYVQFGAVRGCKFERGLKRLLSGFRPIVAHENFRVHRFSSAVPATRKAARILAAGLPVRPLWAADGAGETRYWRSASAPP